MESTHIWTGTTVLAAVSLVLLSGIAPVWAVESDTGESTTPQLEQQSESVQSVEDEVQKRVDEATSSRRNAIIAEATSAIAETRIALQALEDEKPEDALAALERTTGKLEVLLARDPEMALAPMGVTVTTFDLYANPETIRQSIALAEEHLEDGRVQEARRILEMLASEVVYSVTSIPLATYPDAIKRAVPLIDDGSLDEAKAVLQRALNTLVVTDYSVPLPLLRTEALLARAEELLETADRTESQSGELGALISAIRNQMKVADMLGYGKEDDFRKFEKELRAIELKSDAGDSGEGWFDSIRKTMSSLF